MSNEKVFLKMKKQIKELENKKDKLKSDFQSNLEKELNLETKKRVGLLEKEIKLKKNLNNFLESQFDKEDKLNNQINDSRLKSNKIIKQINKIERDISLIPVSFSVSPFIEFEDIEIGRKVAKKRNEVFKKCINQGISEKLCIKQANNSIPENMRVRLKSNENTLTASILNTKKQKNDEKIRGLNKKSDKLRNKLREMDN